MDKRKNCNNINRNNTNILNHIRNRVVRNNLVTPEEIFVSEIWMQEDARNGVEIIELTSSNSEVTPSKHNNLNQAWSFVNNKKLDAETGYRLNKISSERRYQNCDDNFFVSYVNEFLQDHHTQTNSNEFDYMEDTKNLEVPYNHQMNFFSIVNNHIIDSDSSSETGDTRVEEITSDITENNKDNKYWDHVYNDDLVTYDTNIDSEKRTIWIYSFENHRHLADNDFELVNIPSTDSSSQSVTDDDQAPVTRKNRSASPIPTYVPRLDLSLGQTLSTVTETSELKNSEESLMKKSINNWLTERKVQKCSNDITDVVNWMALSPRERRRRFKTTISHVGDDKHKTKDIFTYTEGKTPTQIMSNVIRVDVDVHTNEYPDKPENIEDCIENIEIEPTFAKPKVEKTVSMDISYADVNSEAETETETRDIKYDPKSIPSIKLNKNKTYDIISEPIENLNSDKWIIGEETVEEETFVNDYVQGVEFINKDVKTEVNSSIEDSSAIQRPWINRDVKEERRSTEEGFASQRLWMKEAKLMKSPMWAAYLPITQTPPQLSLSLSSIEGKRSWLRRVAKCFNCCK